MIVSPFTVCFDMHRGTQILTTRWSSGPDVDFWVMEIVRRLKPDVDVDPNFGP
jgi:hypothetical protein